MLSAVEPTTAATSTADRRRFLLLGSWLSVGWASLAATAGVWGVSFLRYLFPNIVIEPSPNRVKVGFVESFPDGQVAEQFKEQNIWIVRKDGFLFALSTTCTHLGCTINWQENAQKFKCPCHGSGYTIAGINVEGPSQRPLERWGIALADDGEIVVDKGRVFQHERGDWNNPESFLRV
jgi:cytochrome b6-f complex iron-sulfur subunit